mmetsp:Transcript_9040/g.17834  ORF Transcript_9040/g.17834 Transcript_9040/m.17834 type:complete len:256 (+) Transcript_9040:283-1050(+)
MLNEALYTVIESRKGNGLLYTICKDAFSQQMMEMQENRYPKEQIVPEYAIGCKRVALAENWMPMLARSNVDLVADKTLKRITATGVEYTDGTKEDADAIIYATGFYSSNFMSQIDIVNGDGLSLQDYWKDIPRAYKSVSVPNFPNLFFLYGPGSNLGHSSIIFMVETQVEYVVRMMSYMVDTGATSLEVKEDLYEEDNVRLQKELQETTFADPSCTSWYKRADGTIVNNWAGNCMKFWYHLSGLDKDAYNLGSRL